MTLGQFKRTKLLLIEKRNFWREKNANLNYIAGLWWWVMTDGVIKDLGKKKSFLPEFNYPIAKFIFD